MNTKNDTKKSTMCMACSCPCEMHKEHNHPVDNIKAPKTCSDCGHEHKNDGGCDCGCN